MKYQKFLPMALFSAFFLKCLIFSFSYPEAVVLAVLAAAMCFFESKNNDKKLKALEEKVMTSIKSFENKVGEVDSIKAQLNSIKIGGLTRSLNVQPNK